MFAQLGYYICMPFAWLTRIFYNLTGSYGIALILFTLLVKLVLLPFQLKSKKSMLRMNRMNGKIKEIQTATPITKSVSSRRWRTCTPARVSIPCPAACGASCPCPS